MAPEQARGEPTGPASDVFSLAATLCFAATGHGPYAPGPAAAVLRRAARNEIRSLDPAVPAELRAPLEQMLDPRPQRRPSAAAVLGGLDGTVVAPVPKWRRPRTATLTRTLASVAARVLGEAGPRPVGRRRRRWATAAAVAVGAALVGLVILVGLGGSSASRPRPLPAASRTPATVCTPLPYLACGSSRPAPHTDGSVCDPGWYDLDGRAGDGCEARSDYVAGTALTQSTAVHANLVPASARDSFLTDVHGDALRFCWGSLHVTLTAPADTAEQLTLWKGSTKVATALSANGAPATATVTKPSCFGADSEQLRATVTALAAGGGASTTDFTLTRDAGW